MRHALCWLPLLALAAAPAFASPVELDMFSSSGFLGPRQQWVIITGLQPGETVTIIAGTEAFGDGECPASLGGACVDLTDVVIIGVATADSDGAATLAVPFDPSVDTGEELVYQAVAVRAGDDAVVSNPVRIRATDNRARLRAVHASPDAPAVDVYVNDLLLLDAAEFGDASGFTTLPAGTYEVDVRPAGAAPDSPPVYTTDVVLAPNEQYTAVATGYAWSADLADAFRITPYAESWGEVDRDEVRVRVIHASPDAPTVALDVDNDGSLEVPSLPRFADTGPDGIALPAGVPLSVGIRTPAGDSVTAFSAPPLPAGGEVVVVAIGELGAHPSYDTGFSALALFRDGSVARILQDPTVYVLHASPDAPAVDVLTGGSSLLGELSYRELSAPIQVPPGSYDLSVVVSDTGAAVETFTSPMLEPGQRYLATAAGFVGGGGEPFQLLVTADTFRDDIRARYIAVHASPDAPPVTIGGVGAGGFTLRVPELVFGAQTRPQGTRIMPDIYTVGIGQVGVPGTLFDIPAVTIDPMSRGIYLATGSVAGGDFGLTAVHTDMSPWTTETFSPAP